VLAECGVGVVHLAVDSQVHEVLALVVSQCAPDEAELDRRLLDALGEVTLVEGEPKLPIFEDVVGARLVIAASRRIHAEGAPSAGAS
jgi:hypothetical protein